MTTQESSRTRRHSYFGRRSFELSLEPWCILSFDGTFTDANGSLESLVGYERQELQGRAVGEFLHPEDKDATLAEIAMLASGDRPATVLENRYRRPDGGWTWMEWTARSAPVESLIYASGRDITGRKQREFELERAAHVDLLTGLANRRGFQRALEYELAVAERHGLRPALVVVDLDHLKQINDRYGHRAGDAVIRAAAKALEATLRASDFAARTGGDEFAVLLPNCDPQTAEFVTGKIVTALGRLQPERPDDEPQVSASAGVALLGEHGIKTGADLMSAADKAMYRAKAQRGSYAIYE